MEIDLRSFADTCILVRAQDRCLPHRTERAGPLCYGNLSPAPPLFFNNTLVVRSGILGISTGIPLLQGIVLHLSANEAAPLELCFHKCSTEQVFLCLSMSVYALECVKCIDKWVCVHVEFRKHLQESPLRKDVF